jgi:hypothetical protein
VEGGLTHTAPSKYHDEIISLAFIRTKYGEPIAIMVFRRAMQKARCLSPPDLEATLALGPEADLRAQRADEAAHAAAKPTRAATISAANVVDAANGGQLGAVAAAALRLEAAADVALLAAAAVLARE